MRENAEIIKQGISIKSIIKDYTKLRDWELKILAERGYEEAISERQRRIECNLTLPNHKS